MLHISAVPSGLACGCVCAGCGGRLVAKKGPEVEHHFAHYSTHACVIALETTLHRVAKQVIEERKLVMLPAIEAESGELRKKIRGPTSFRPDAVVLEQPMPGMKPDLIARKTDKDGVVKELVIEVAVTHFCGPEKIALIRNRQIAAIEIDLSGVSRNSSEAYIAEAIVAAAPRKWLFNRIQEHETAALKVRADKIEAERQAREMLRNERRAAELKSSADRLAAVYRRPSSATDNEAVATGAERDMTRVRDAGFEDLVGLEMRGNGCFDVPPAIWQSAIVERFLLGQGQRYEPMFRTKLVLEQMTKRELLKDEFTAFLDEDLVAALNARIPSFRTPFGAIEDYLTRLKDQGLLTTYRDYWCLVDAKARAARDRVREADARRDRLTELGDVLRDLLAKLPDGGSVDARAWMRTRHEGLSATPAELANQGEYPFSQLLSQLGELRRMLDPKGPVVEQLLGLPLGAHRDSRREEQQKADEARRRRKEEAERKAAEAERLAAAGRLRELQDAAVRYLGYEDGQAWLARPLAALGGRSVGSQEGLSQDEHDAAQRMMWNERRQQIARAEQEKAAADLRERLLEQVTLQATMASLPTGWAELWMRQVNSDLAGRPDQICVDEPRYERCLEALKNSVRRARRRR